MAEAPPVTAPPEREALIASLTAGLRRTRRLPGPWVRTALWLGATLWLAFLLAMLSDLHGLAERIMRMPDMGLALLGSLLTGVLAGAAAFLTSVPGRSPAWALMPLPALALWIGESTAGCLRLRPAPGTVPEPPMHGMVCLYFIVLVSIPLAAVLLMMIRRACPLRPGLTASLAGLASAGTAATLLAFIHPYDATMSDLALHAVAVALVVAAMRGSSGFFFRTGTGSAPPGKAPPR
jgi:hypothetical protein